MTAVWSSEHGGHAETGVVAEILRAARVDVLHNRSLDFDVRGQALRLVGMGDLWAPDCNPDAAFARASAARVPTVLLSHNPDTKEHAGRYAWDLLLSGHTHGGQVVVPLVGLNPAPVLDKRYVAGLNPWRDRQVHTSAGVGNAYGWRFNCRPEITLLTLLPRE